jgi:hypothetical protein
VYHAYVCIFIHIERERQKERERKRERERKEPNSGIFLCCNNVFKLLVKK